MIAVDTNILVYAFREDSKFHANAWAALSMLAEGSEPWALPWVCVHEFVSVVTNKKIYTDPAPLTSAFDFIDPLFTSPSLLLLSEQGAYWSTFEELCHSAKLSGPSIHDARVAALCLSHGVKMLLSADRDFQKFPKLKTKNPLV